MMQIMESYRMILHTSDGNQNHHNGGLIEHIWHSFHRTRHRLKDDFSRQYLSTSVSTMYQTKTF
jgi:hypothetical protein